MFQFSAFAYYTPILQIGRLPHSETRGSIRICRSPRLIAACRVLHRLWEPRHPPCALFYFLHRTALLLPYGCFRLSACADCHCCLLFLSLFLFSSDMSKNFCSGARILGIRGKDSVLFPCSSNPSSKTRGE